jgi:outer membrane immunogenic protein
MTSRFIALALAVGGLFSAPMAAQAADLARPAPYYAPPSYVAPTYATWTGFYVGINAGYGGGEADFGAFASDPWPKGFLVGGTLGYNLQTGNFVWGLEGDIAYSAVKDDVGCGGGGTCEAKMPWFATARGRIGYAGWGSLMPYITGGAAFASLKAEAPGGDETATRVGWTVGAGVEYALWSNWSVKLEYLYADFGEMDCAACGDVKYKPQFVRAGLNYRF